MTGLRDLLRKKDRFKNEPKSADPKTAPVPELTILRSDTHTQEIIKPPEPPGPPEPEGFKRKDYVRPGLGPLRSTSGASNASGSSRVSSILHLRSLSKDKSSSVNVPANLPAIASDNVGNAEDKEAQWEQRATILGLGGNVTAEQHRRSGSSPSRKDGIGDAHGDDDIQEAIKLHESGDLKSSTAMFGRLADSSGANNVLAQVLFGLALRHGWGIEIDLDRAITYLSRAAENSSLVESQALSSGMKKGGAAKGELVLAIFELGNCFRNGWGVEKDPVAARSYYETAANCGDLDAMLEVARCYEEGIGVKKNKFKAASYYREAEKNGSKLVGNSWIWKDKYNTGPSH